MWLSQPAESAANAQQEACLCPHSPVHLPPTQEVWRSDSGWGFREAGRGLGVGEGEEVTAAGIQSSAGAISSQLRECHQDGPPGGASEGGAWWAEAQ